MKTKKLLFLALMLLTGVASWGQVSITGTGSGNTYTQDFNTLASSGSSNTTVPVAWVFVESGSSSANNTYAADTGSGTAGNTYSYGSTNASDRALGGLQSSSVIPTIGVSFTNNTGQALSELIISYTGEQWRLGTANRVDRLDFQYSLNATSLTSGTWTDVDNLDFIAPVTSPTGAKDGNAPANKTLVSYTITGLSIANGSTFWLRFNDLNATGSDDGLAIDDFSIYVTGGATTAPEINIKGNNTSITDGDSSPSTTDHTDFGTVVTSTNVVRTFTIENTGSADLVLTAPYVQLTLGGQGFSVTQQPALTTIPSGQSTTFQVTFNSATAGTFTEGIEVLSNDTDEANYSFDITAIAQVPTPEINVKGNNTSIVMGDTTPSTTDHTNFGSAIINENIVRTFTIENTGTGTLNINNISMNIGAKYTIGGISLPATVAAGSSTTFTVTFNSATAGTFADTVMIDNNDANESTYDFAVTATANTVNFSVGDISIIAISADTPDSFVFVNWVPIPDGAQLSFTDNSYDGTQLKTNEGTKIWTNNTGSSIAIGTAILVNADTNTADIGSVTNNNSFSLSAGGETILLYEGTSTNPYFIHGLSKGSWKTTGTVTTSDSYLPSSLNVTNGNIALGTNDNYDFNGSRDNQEEITEYKTIVNTPSKYRGSNTYFALSSVDFTTCPYWNGTNWINGTPSSTIAGVIKGAYNTSLNGAFVTKDLTIKAGGSLTIDTNPITVHGNITNNLTAGAFVINNGGTLLQPNNITTNANTGNITYNRTSASMNQYDYTYWSTPVTGEDLGVFTNTDKLYSFNPNTQEWNHLNLSVASNTLPMSNGVGYIGRITTNGTQSAAFEGIPNNGNIAITGINSTGAEKYILLGNPYPSALDLELLQEDNVSVLGQTFYFWTHGTAYNGTNYSASDYATYSVELGAGTNGTVGTLPGTRYVSAGQGFFANLNSGGVTNGTLTYKNSHRVIDNNTNFFRMANVQATTQNTIADKIWFNLTNTNGAFKQTLLAYTQNAINGYDPVDATTFDGQPTLDFYTLTEDKKLVIQARAPFVNTDTVPVGYRTTQAGTYQIAIDHLDNVWNNQNIYLKDKLTNTTHDIKNSPYSFTTNAGTFDTRFEIVYQTNALSNSDISFENGVIVFANDKNITIQSAIETIKDIVVYDLQGRIITNKANINAMQIVLENLKAQTQVLFVKVTSTEGKTTIKKVVF